MGKAKKAKTLAEIVEGLQAEFKQIANDEIVTTEKELASDFNSNWEEEICNTCLQKIAAKLNLALQEGLKGVRYKGSLGISLRDKCNTSTTKIALLGKDDASPLWQVEGEILTCTIDATFVGI